MSHDTCQATNPQPTENQLAPTKPTTRRGVQLHKTNPFFPKLQIKRKKKTSRTAEMALINRGMEADAEQYIGVAGFWEWEEVDSERFIKLFLNGVRVLEDLTTAGQKVFTILYRQMRTAIDKDEIYLSYVGLNDEDQQSISRATFKRGLSELISKEFIAAQVRPGWYWLNPNYIFNGDRLHYVKSYYCREMGLNMPIKNSPAANPYQLPLPYEQTSSPYPAAAEIEQMRITIAEQAETIKRLEGRI